MEDKSVYIDRMVSNLAVLRARLGITQMELADMAGVSRQTILSIEKKQRDMTWSMFLALLNIFASKKETASLIDLFEIRPEGLGENLHLEHEKSENEIDTDDSCVFCGGSNDLLEYKGKKVCKSCVAGLKF